MRWWLAMFAGAALAAAPQDRAEPPADASAPAAGVGEFRLEKHAISGGAELLTVFGHMAGSGGEITGGAGIPLVSVLRDTLGDSNRENDRLRYVWVLTAARPTLLQRIAAATPFYYWRAGAFKNPDKVPSPALDLGSASKPVWSSLAATTAQFMAFDPNGALLRASTRSYRNNARDHRQLHLLEGLTALSHLEDAPCVDGHLTESELLTIQARLALAARTLGGLVRDSSLPGAYMKQRTRTMEDRGHNWELLRQRAEANGLYFEPYGLDGSPTQAILWIAREDAGGDHAFDGKFLGISDPYGDERIRNWTGYSQRRSMGAGRRPVELIPLAFYSLDHPKVPLLLVDFRETHAPKRREMFRRALVDGVSGIAGISRWADLPYFAGASMLSFIRSRHGAADSRAERIRAYSQTRQWLAFDPKLDAGLRAEIHRRLEILGVNPLEDKLNAEARFAGRQYEALQSYAGRADGLAALLEKDRAAEALAYDHGPAGRAGLQLARYATLWIYRHREESSAVLGIRIDAARRAGRRSSAATGP